MVLLVLIVCILYILYNRNSRIILTLTSLQILSIVSTFVIGMDKPLESLSIILLTVVNAIYNLLFIRPWRTYENISFIQDIPESKIDTFYRISTKISSFVFVILLLTSTFVLLYVDDINQFKYGDDFNYVDFFYTQLPFSPRWLILANTLHFISYFLIPLHFYYLMRGNGKKAFWCGLFSANIILYGLTFFSRWTILSFVSIYAVFFLMLKSQIPIKLLNKELKLITIGFAALGFVFTVFTISRFSSEESSFTQYNIPKESKIKDQTLYSVFEYAGQAFPYGIEMMQKYEGPKFGCKYALSYTWNFLNSFGILPQSDFQKQYERLWPNHWWRFTGLTAISLWDMGILGALILAYFYNRLVVIKRKEIGLLQMLKAVIFIQIPLTSIFYSLVPTVIFLFILYTPIKYYLKKS